MPQAGCSNPGNPIVIAIGGSRVPSCVDLVGRVEERRQITGLLDAARRGEAERW